MGYPTGEWKQVVIKGCCDCLQTVIEKSNAELWFEGAEFLFYCFLLLLGKLFFLAYRASKHFYVLQNLAVNIEIYFDFHELYNADWAKEGSSFQDVFVFRFVRVWQGLSRSKMLRGLMCLANALE